MCDLGYYFSELNESGSLHEVYSSAVFRSKPSPWTPPRIGWQR